MHINWIFVCIFSKIDLLRGYLQLPQAEDKVIWRRLLRIKEYGSFVHYCSVVFKKVILVSTDKRFILDNILVYSRTVAEHD